jgi:hypothetical protein
MKKRLDADWLATKYKTFGTLFTQRLEKKLHLNKKVRYFKVYTSIKEDNIILTRHGTLLVMEVNLEGAMIGKFPERLAVGKSKKLPVLYPEKLQKASP